MLSAAMLVPCTASTSPTASVISTKAPLCTAVWSGDVGEHGGCGGKGVFLAVPVATVLGEITVEDRRGKAMIVAFAAARPVGVVAALPFVFSACPVPPLPVGWAPGLLNRTTLSEPTLAITLPRANAAQRTPPHPHRRCWFARSDPVPRLADGQARLTLIMCANAMQLITDWSAANLLGAIV